MLYVDAGYYSYYIGSRTPFAYWLGAVDPAELELMTFLMDAPTNTSVRASEFSYYKGRRAERRVSDEAKAAIREMVEEFRRSLVHPAFRLSTVSLPRYEADDLVALTVLRGLGEGDRILGIDKDYAQLPEMGVVYQDAAGLIHSPSARMMRDLPIYSRNLLLGRSTNRHFAIYQALVGDRSDSIVRVIPVNRRESQYIMESLFWDELPPSRVLSSGALLQFYTNLRLVTLPHPSLCWGDPHGEELYDLLYTGHYDQMPFTRGFCREA